VAFLTVQEGCDKFCTFCVVPYTRGAESRARPRGSSTRPRQLVDSGVREITLLGQNVNAWHGDGPDGGTGRWPPDPRWPRSTGIERIRYTTSHPRDMDDALIAAHGTCQETDALSASAGAVGLRPGPQGDEPQATAPKDYVELVDRIRAPRPDIAMSGDFIVGFPGETDADFEDTMRLVDEVGYAQAFSFQAIRRGPARRPQQAAFNAAMLGRTVPVLFEKPGREPGQMSGRSPWLQPVHAQLDTEWLGRIVPVRIEAQTAHALRGRAVPSIA
jgi:tRNA-2-methylthio-N6-dimethylallyladenosine synthase